MTRGAADNATPKPSLIEQISTMDWKAAYDALLQYLTYGTGAIGIGDLKDDPKELGKSLASQITNWPNVGIGAEGRKKVLKVIDTVLIKLEIEVLGTKVETEAQRSAAHKAIWLGAVRRGMTDYFLAWANT